MLSLNTLRLLFPLLLSPPILAVLLLPIPPGLSNAQLRTFELIDHSRIDPSAPCCHAPRRLMVSVFTPATCWQTTPVPYMPPATATYYDQLLSEFGVPSGTLGSFRLQVCPQTAASLPKPAPLLLFSPGLGTSRLIYSSLVQWIASKGFTVVSIDHPYDSDIVEFPDGTVIKGNVTSETELPSKLATRVQDASFVLTQLSDRSITNQLPFSRPHPVRSRAGIFGHSFGGATAGNAMLTDKRFIGGLNLDGSMFPLSLNISDSRPFVLMAAQGHNQTTDESWYAFWQHLTGWKLQLEVNTTKHLSYSDFPVLAELLGIDPVALPPVGELIGTIDGLRMIRIVRTYVGSFFDFVLKGKNDGVLEGPRDDFPEVSFRNSSQHKY